MLTSSASRASGTPGHRPGAGAGHARPAGFGRDHVRDLCRPVADQQPSFMQSLFQPQADELIDFGLAQLITDTNDIRSVIRGHSLARDMYGNDATRETPLLWAQPERRGCRSRSARSTQVTGTNQYTLTTNIQSNDTAFYGYNFSRWIMRVKLQLRCNSPLLISLRHGG